MIPVEASGPRLHLSRVLLVANKEHRNTARAVLEGDGFLVFETADPDEAFALVADLAIDLVIVGLSLPDLGGFDVVADLCPTRRVPVIVLAGSPRGAKRTVALQLGIEDCLDEHRIADELVPSARAALCR